MARPSARETAETASELALAGLAFLAEEPARLERFLALTGIGPDDLRQAAGEGETLLAVLDHLLADESLLLVFAASKQVAPESIVPARAALAHALGQGAVYD